MNSKISCWRFVRSTIGQRAPSADSKTNVCSTSVQRPRTDPQRPLPYTPPHAGDRGGIGRRARLRALWAVWPVVVRVHSIASRRGCRSLCKPSSSRRAGSARRLQDRANGGERHHQSPRLVADRSEREVLVEARSFVVQGMYDNGADPDQLRCPDRAPERVEQEAGPKPSPLRPAIDRQPRDQADRDWEVLRRPGTHGTRRLIAFDLSGDKRVIAGHLTVSVGDDERAARVSPLTLARAARSSRAERMRPLGQPPQTRLERRRVVERVEEPLRLVVVQQDPRRYFML